MLEQDFGDSIQSIPISYQEEVPRHQVQLTGSRIGLKTGTLYLHPLRASFLCGVSSRTPTKQKRSRVGAIPSPFSL
jgi:hypothetical protein